MAYMTFERGIKCKCCGELYVPPFKRSHCNKCGAELMKSSAFCGNYFTHNVKPTIIRVTHKLFYKICEEIR